MCENGYEYEYFNKNGMESISMDYSLVCEKRLTEATMMSIGFFGEVAAFIIAVFTEVPKTYKTNVLSLAMLI